MKTEIGFIEAIQARIPRIYNSLLKTDKFWIELSPDYPPDYLKVSTEITTGSGQAKIEGYYGSYDLENKKVIIYLPVVAEPCCHIAIPAHLPKSLRGLLSPLIYPYFVTIIIYFEVAQWFCHSFLSKETFETKQFYNVGSLFRNFVGMMLAYECIKCDEDIRDMFPAVVDLLTDDYRLCLKFIENGTI